MAQKLWEKNVQVDHEVDIFTVGKDREMDLYLAKYDVLGSMAHITMLESIGLLIQRGTKRLISRITEYIRRSRSWRIHHRGRHRGCALAGGTHAYTPFGRYGQEDP